MAYFRPDGIRFVDYFPWITLPADPPAGVDGAFLDQSLPHRQRHRVHAAVLLLLILAAVPVIFAAAAPTRARRWLRAPWSRASSSPAA